jgi:hypothetical protein
MTRQAPVRKKTKMMVVVWCFSTRGDRCVMRRSCLESERSQTTAAGMPSGQWAAERARSPTKWHRLLPPWLMMMMRRRRRMAHP